MLLSKVCLFILILKVAFYDEKLNYTKVHATEGDEKETAATVMTHEKSNKPSDVVHVKTFPDENTFRVKNQLNNNNNNKILE